MSGTIATGQAETLEHSDAEFKADTDTAHVSFSPGKIGMRLALSSGLVKAVRAGTAAESNGVVAGMRMVAIDGTPYSQALLRAKIGGCQEYVVAFTGAVVNAGKPSPASLSQQARPDFAMARPSPFKIETLDDDHSSNDACSPLPRETSHGDAGNASHGIVQSCAAGSGAKAARRLIKADFLDDPHEDASSSEHIICIGNSGSGKSTLLNSLIGSPHFRSGFSCGMGLTSGCETYEQNGMVYVDTPGLADALRRQQAAEAIDGALQAGTLSKILFVITLEAGHVRPQDQATIELVIDALPDGTAAKNCMLIVNKASRQDIARIRDGEFTADFLPSTYVAGVEAELEKEDHDDQVLILSKELQDYIARLPSVKLDCTNVKQIQHDKFERLRRSLEDRIEKLKTDNPIAPAEPAPGGRFMRKELVKAVSGGLDATPHEQALANGRYRDQFAILNANQKLVKDRFATLARTHLVRFEDGDSQNSTAMKVRNFVTRRRQQIPEQGVITLSESWTDEALRYLGSQHRSGGVKLAALSYANCTYIGGNYTDGGMTKAQEEELCRLFPAMFESLRQVGSQGDPGRELISYEHHLFGARFEDGYKQARNVLFLEEITCMRNGAPMNYKLLQPKHQVDAGFIIAAAPLLGRGGDASFTKWLREPAEWYDKLFLNVFLAPKTINPAYDVIVVGPFGCGAFGNDPTTVVQAFLTVIRKYDILHLYREIHFCLGRSTVRTVGGANVNNAEVFRRELAKSGIPCDDISGDLNRAVSNWDREEKGS